MVTKLYKDQTTYSQDIQNGWVCSRQTVCMCVCISMWPFDIKKTLTNHITIKEVTLLTICIYTHMYIHTYLWYKFIQFSKDYLCASMRLSLSLSLSLSPSPSGFLDTQNIAFANICMYMYAFIENHQLQFQELPRTTYKTKLFFN